MSAVNQNQFSFGSFQKAWNKGVEAADISEISEMLAHNPLLNQTLLLQGSALAVKDITRMHYPLILGDVENVCGWSKELFFLRRRRGPHCPNSSRRPARG